MSGKAKINLNDIADFMFALLLIYFMRSMWPSIPTLPLLDIFMKMMFVETLLLKIAISRLKRSQLNYLLLLGIILLYLLTYVVARPVSIEPYIKMVMFAMGAMAYQACETNKYNALKHYVRIIYIIAIASLGFWIFGSILGIIHPSGVVYSLWTGSNQKIPINNYFYIHFEPQKEDILLFTQVTRNSSIFAEAPMFSFHLCITLLYELFIRTKIDFMRLAVLLACIISTISMTGYIVAAVSLSVKYIITGEKKNAFKVFRILLFPATVIALSIVLESIITTKIASYSGSVRMDDFSAGYQAWMNSPLFGNGYNNMKSIQQHMSAFRFNNTGFSNSPMLILAYGGLYLAGPYLVAIYYCFKKTIGDTKKLCFLVLFLFIVIITNVPFQPLILYMFSWIITGGKETDIVALQKKKLVCDLSRL